jgi:L-aminopeptidase/D-esterase-like protein
MLVEHVHAVLLTGGSAFGLAAADGVMSWLEERGVGFEVGDSGVRVPIVPAAVLFDLGTGDPFARPGPTEGRAACEAAGEDVQEGPVGAATGATVAKVHGPERAAPGGMGTVVLEESDLLVGALAAVNALGEIVDDEGEVIVGAASGDDEPPDPPPAGNTTLAVVATNARLTRERAHLLAIAAHDGLSAAIRPAHTKYDGDTVFTLATGSVEAEQRTVERLAIQAVAEAIRRGVRGADPSP